jgi:ketosteroid isomerase-like protein
MGLTGMTDHAASPSPPVSTAPADVVRRQYLASAAGDLEALRATLAPDVEWTEMAGFPLAGTYRTPTGVTSQVMERLGAEWDDWTAHDDTYVTEGEHVVVLARYTATNKATGKALDVRVAHHFTVRGGQIVRFEQFVDTAGVHAAMRPGVPKPMGADTLGVALSP